jgi:hypothetical protein
MPLQQRQPTSPGLARLLADASEERRAALAAAWAVPPEGGSLAARLYHQMTDPDRLRAALDALEDNARLAFRFLAGAPRPRTVRELARVLPFDESALEALLVGMAGRGLAWRRESTGTEREAAEPQWLVPRDLAQASRTRQTRISVSRPPRPSGDALALAPLARAPATVQPGGTAATLVGEWLPIAEGPKALASYVKHAEAALGVWEERDGARTPGPRYAAWVALPEVERVRALARLWLVDDAGTAPLAPEVRQAVRSALLTLEPGSWYDFDQVARLVARRAAELVPDGATRIGSSPAGAGRATFGRRDLERAIEVLSWIGVVALGGDQAGRPVAVSLTPRGLTALN